MSGYVKTFKVKNYKSMAFRIDDEKLLENCKTIWTEIADLHKLCA